MSLKNLGHFYNSAVTDRNQNADTITSWQKYFITLIVLRSNSAKRKRELVIPCFSGILRHIHIETDCYECQMVGPPGSLATCM